MLWSLILWAGLSVLFLWRLRVILSNFQYLVEPQERILQLFPVFNLRPLKQLVIWLAELAVLLFLYQALGTAMLAHMVATVIAASLMVMMRERSERNFLRAIQVLPMRPPARRAHFRFRPSWSS